MGGIIVENRRTGDSRSRHAASRQLLSACLRWRTLIGTYLVCFFFQIDRAVLCLAVLCCAVLCCGCGSAIPGTALDARRQHARTVYAWYKKKPTKSSKNVRKNMALLKHSEGGKRIAGR